MRVHKMMLESKKRIVNLHINSRIVNLHINSRVSSSNDLFIADFIFKLRDSWKMDRKDKKSSKKIELFAITRDCEGRRQIA